MPFRSGDRVRINYVCRLKNGELTASTYRDGAISPEEKRSAIYLALKNDAPLEWIAGQEKVSQSGSAPFDFADAIAVQLGQAVVGQVPGTLSGIEVAAAKAPVRPSGTIRLAKVRRRPRGLHMTVDEYKGRTGKNPEIGQEMTFDPAIPGKVTSVSESEVVVDFHAPVGELIDTPFGRARVSADQNSYLLEILVEKGDLVRSGPMVGKVADVDDAFFTVDYGHPLAGQNLVCDVEVSRGEESQIP
ncbi:MAG: hypothetical protein R2940_18380 [Syntrophotaleaceae bacterium]